MIFLFRWGLIGFAFLWSIVTLPAEYTRLMYVGIRQSISAGELVESAELNAAIAFYDRIEKIGICMPGLREQYAFLLSSRESLHEGAQSLDKGYIDINRSEQVLKRMLACSPFESNQWLSMAMLDAKQNGIRDQVFGYLRLSYLTAPREGWIIERRLTFAASIAPLLPVSLIARVQRDIEEMRHNRMGSVKRRFLKRLNFKSLDEFERLFS